jgi:RNA polymerase sigma factor (sigma-70 family)
VGAAAVLVGLRQAVDRTPVAAQTDDYLVARLRAGDDVAFEAIYDRYARGVLAFCVHMLGSREAAEDALQLTFVSAYRALRDGDRKIALRPWLYTIARNRCLSELRSRRDTVDVDQVVVDRAFFDGLADQVQRREELREMVEDMQRLPADQRAALVLFELGDQSHNEIAAVLGVRREKVKALIFQAREALVRSRQARERPCAEIRGRLATLHGRVLPRSMTRAHIDRCPSCSAFEDEVRRQRAALALILPVALTGELKASVLGAALGGGGGVAAGVGAVGSGAVVAGAAGGGAAGSGAIGAGGATAVGGATAAGGAGGAGVLAAGGLAGAGAPGAAVVAGAPVAVFASGLTAVGATGVVAKILTAAVIATGAAGAIHRGSEPGPVPGPAIAQEISITSVRHAVATITAISGAPTPAATPSAANTSTEPTPAAAPSATNTATTAVPSGSGTASSATGAGATTAAVSGSGTATPATGASATTAAVRGCGASTAATGAGATTAAAASGSGTATPATGAGATTAAAPSKSRTKSPATGAGATTAAAPSKSCTKSPATGAGATTAAAPSESRTASRTPGAGATTAAPSDFGTASPATGAAATTAAPSDSSPATPPTGAGAASDPVRDPTGASASGGAVAPTAASSG